jgi:hypothetical protein
MILAKTVLLLAALVAPNQPIAVAVEVWPNAVKSRGVEFNVDMVQRALVRSMRDAGITTVNSAEGIQLTVEIAVVKTSSSLPFDHNATIAALVKLIEPGRSGQAAKFFLQGASCSASAKVDVRNSVARSTEMALTRCIDQLAAEISESIVRRRNTIFVR